MDRNFYCDNFTIQILPVSLYEKIAKQNFLYTATDFMSNGMKLALELQCSVLINNIRFCNMYNA